MASDRQTETINLGTRSTPLDADNDYEMVTFQIETKFDLSSTSLVSVEFSNDLTGTLSSLEATGQLPQDVGVDFSNVCTEDRSEPLT